jgi:hypothetical protein
MFDIEKLIRREGGEGEGQERVKYDISRGEFIIIRLRLSMMISWRKNFYFRYERYENIFVCEHNQNLK